MRRRILFLLVTGLSASLQAQSPNSDQARKAAEAVDKLYAAYTAEANLKNISRGNSDKKIADFRALFAAGATIDDEINPSDTLKWNISTVSGRSVDDYLASVRANFRNGLIGTFNKANISYDGIAQHTVKIVYERNVSATNSLGYRFTNLDTMVMSISLSGDFSTAAISSIARAGGRLQCIGCPDNNKKQAAPAPVANNDIVSNGKPSKPKNEEKQVEPKPEPKPKNTDKTASSKPAPSKKQNVRCPDDDDCDGVPNLLDRCPEEPGPASNHGCPLKEPAVQVGLSIFVGGGGGIEAVGSSPGTNYAGFQFASDAPSDQASYSSKAGGGFNAGMDLDLFFGKKKNIGLSLGVNIMQNFVNANVSNFVEYYTATDGNGDNFTRLLSAPSYNEKQTFTNVSIPILFKYQSSPNKKLGFDLEVGPVLSCYSSASSNASATMNFEAIYGADPTLGAVNAPSGFNPWYGNSAWVITQQSVAQHLSGSNTVQSVFSSYYGSHRYVGLGYSYSGSAGSVSYGFGGGGLLRLGGIYRIKKTVSLVFGAYALVSYNSHSVGAYQPFAIGNDFQNTSPVFKSFLNGLGGSTTAQFGANLGIQVRFLKKNKTASSASTK